MADEQANLDEETKPKHVSLEEKLADDHELEAIGISNLSQMSLTDKDVPLIVERVLSKVDKCIGIILRENQLTSYGVKILVDEFIATKSKLKYLSLSNNPRIGDAGVEQLVRFLRVNRSMLFLSIPNTGITDHSVRILADVLCGSEDHSIPSSLEKLHISYNKAIGDESVPALVQIIEKNQTLKLLSVQNCNLSEKARRQLRKSVTQRKNRKFNLNE